MTEHFWQSEGFSEFLPHIRATAAWDKRQGKPRFDLSTKTPYVTLQRALAFRGGCAECGREIAPFRSRQAEAKRGKGGQGIYLAACCPLDVRVGCSRGKKATLAYGQIAELVKGVRGTQQEGLL